MSAIKWVWHWLVSWLKIRPVLAAVTLAVGFCVARLLPPFVLDGPFWRDFWSGPPMAGIFAVLAASIAYRAAVHSAAEARMAAAAESARKQVEMAITMAVDDSSTKRMVGLNLLDTLFGKHEGSLDDLILSVSVQVTGIQVDGIDANGDNREEMGDGYEI